MDMFKRQSSLGCLLLAQLVLVQLCLLALNQSEAADPLVGVKRSLSRRFDRTSSDEVDSMPYYDADDGLDGDLVHWPAKRAKKEPSRSALGEAIESALTRTKYYYDLIKRFITWRSEYNKLQKELGNDRSTGQPILKDAVDVLRFEYAKVDQELHMEACMKAGHNTLSGEIGFVMDDDEEEEDEVLRKTESVRFIMRILGRLIDRLELRLVTLRRGGVAAAQDHELRRADAMAEQEIERIEEAVKKATDRAKRIAKQTATDFVKQEVKFLANTFVLNQIATYVVNVNANAGSSASTIMSSLEPFILLLGLPNTPLIWSYLINTGYRVVASVISNAWPLFMCKRDTLTTPKPIALMSFRDGK